MLAFVFREDKRAGNLSIITDETVDAAFFPADALPPTSEVYRETVEDLKDFNGR